MLHFDGKYVKPSFRAVPLSVKDPISRRMIGSTAMIDISVRTILEAIFIPFPCTIFVSSLSQNKESSGWIFRMMVFAVITVSATTIDWKTDAADDME